MDLFDLLFIVLFLTAVGVVLSCAVSAVTGHVRRALKRLVWLAVSAAIYMVVVAGSGLGAPQRVLSIGENDCSDDWCIAVVGASRSAGADHDTIAVTFRISSRARRVPQRERFVSVYVREPDGSRRYPTERSGDRPFDVTLQPGEAVPVARLFLVDKRASGLGVVLTREGGGWFPGCCVIGEGLFHKPPIVRIG